VNIYHTPITTGHYQRGGNTRRGIVLHATAGKSDLGDHTWLLKGGDPRRPISVHYLVTRTGIIYRYLEDVDIGWHAGESSGRLDGKIVNGWNAHSIGIELSNRNDGNEPYPSVQVQAAIRLTQHLMLLHNIPATNVVRHVDISAPRKSDPRGLNWAAFHAALTAAEQRRYTVTSPLLAPMPPALLIATMQRRIIDRAVPAKQYTAWDIEREIMPRYIQLCEQTGIDLVIALAQMCHETGVLSSFWSDRPQRNPAGIGVNGQHSPIRLPPFTHWHYNTQRRRWEYGVAFASWQQSIPAHVGRLAAYAIKAGKETKVQAKWINEALTHRALPARYRGIAPTLAGLNGTWAAGDLYAQAVATTANWLIRDKE
jgi:hypothetical protein